MKFKSIITAAFFAITALSAAAQSNNIVEEVAWVVGDQPIWKSEIEAQYMNLLRDKTPIQGDPYCIIPEMIAVEKLYLHQADMDTIEANEGAVIAEVDSRIAYYLNMFQT